MLKKLFRRTGSNSMSANRRPDPSVPGFRHRVHEPEYARLGLPFCRQDSIRKLETLLNEEVDSRARD